jgi:serine protease
MALLLGCLNAPPPATAYTVTQKGGSSSGGSVPTGALRSLLGQRVTVPGHAGNLVRTGSTFNDSIQKVTSTATNPAATGVNVMASPIPFVQYSLQGLWSSPTLSDSLSLVRVSSSAAKAPLHGLNVRRFSAFTSPAATDRIIIRYKAGIVKTQSLTSRLLGYGKIVQSVATPRMTFDVMTFDTSGGRTIDDALAYCRSLPEVAYAEPDGIVHAFGTPDDTDFGDQWNFTQLNMPNVWETVTGNPAVVVAVVDTGLYRSLPDFAASKANPVHVQSGYNAITQMEDSSTTSDPTASSDDNGHGTHVSGTIAESTNDGFEVAGMAYGVTLLPVKVLDKTGQGFWSDVAAGIEWAIRQTPKPAVINLSLGSSQPNATLHAALLDAYNAGVAVVAAAGNEGSGQVDYPAAYQDCVLSVGATGVKKELAYYSNYGPQLGVVAPGGDDSVFPSTSPQSYQDWIWQETITGYNESTGQTDYAEGLFGYEGTSMAAPHVSALAALLRSQNARMTPAEIYNRIEHTADDLGTPGRDDTYGYGLIDPAAALGTSSSHGQNQAVAGAIQLNAAPASYTFHPSENSAATFEANITSGSGNLILKLYDSNGVLLATSPASRTPVLSYIFNGAGVSRIEVDSVQ